MRSNSTNRPDCADGRAFSLIEMMVAVSLLAVIIVGLLAMFYQVQRAFRAGTTQSDIMEGGRATMSLLVRDVAEMVASRHEWITNCVIEPALGLNSTAQDLSAPASVPRQNHLQDFQFLTRVNDEWFGTSYRVAFASNGVGVLYRFTTNHPADTLPWSTDNIVSNIAVRMAGIGPENDPSYHRVLDGVVDLKFTPYDTNGFLYFNTNVDTNGMLIRNTFNNIPGFHRFRSNALPAYLDIELAVLEPSTLAKFRVREEIGPAQAAEYLARQIGKTQVFRQRIAIRPAATDVGVHF